MMKVFSSKFLVFFKNARVTSRCALNLIGLALFIYILGAIVFQIDAFSIFAFPLPLGVDSSNEDKPVKLYVVREYFKALVVIL
jgi:hypothetical protein